MGLIDKGAEQPVSFEEGMRAAEEAAGIPTDEELYGQEWATPEPDETGRIPSMSRPKDDEGNVVVDEPSAEETAVEAPEAETTTDDSEPVVEPPAVDDRVLAELQELKSKVGTLVNENAELRRAQQAQPIAQVDGDWFESVIDQSPGEAAYFALQNKRPDLYERAIRTWYDVDPVAATRYERQVEMQAFTEQLQPQFQTAKDLQQKQELEVAISAVKEKHPDFEQVVGSLDESSVAKLVEDGFPLDTLALLGGDARQKQSALESLFRWVSHDHASIVQAAAPKLGAEAQEEAKARKKAATVASATTTTPETVEETEGERLARVWAEQRPSMRSAWENRSSAR